MKTGSYQPGPVKRVEIPKGGGHGRVLALIDGYMRQDVMKSMERWSTATGTPQGAVISPLLVFWRANFGRRSGVRPWEWTDWAVGIAPSAGLPEDGSHDEAPITQRRVQAAGR